MLHRVHYYKGNSLHLSTLLISLIEYMQNLLQPLLNRQDTFQIIQTFFRSPGHFPYHPDTFSRLSRHFLDHPETFSRVPGHFLDRQETFQADHSDTFLIIRTLSLSSGHIF